tara:strand:- start:1228 stop:3450 length:2223 start_codon:yes stop_codon:yes gene_type:complete
MSRFFFVIFFLNFSFCFTQTIKIEDIQTGIPIQGALINLNDSTINSSKSFFSDLKGEVVINDIKSVFHLSVRHLSYEPFQNYVNFKSDTLLIKLKKITNPLTEVVVTGQLDRSTVHESVNNLILLSNKEIKSSASNNLGDLLNQNALFDISFDPAIGSTGLSVQGMSGNNINILLDGVPIVGRKASQIDLSQINLSNIKKIEILKGPGSVSYGTNSTGGVINLISKQPISNQIIFESYLESIGIAKMHLNIDRVFKVGKLNFNLGKYAFGGVTNNNSRSQIWKWKEQNFLNLQFHTNLNNLDLLHKISFAKNQIKEFNDPQPSFPPTSLSGFALDRFYNTNRFNHYLRIKNNISKYNWTGTLSYSDTKFINQQFIVDTLLNTSIQSADSLFNTQDRYKVFHGRLELLFPENNESLALKFGFEYKNENVYGSRIIKGSPYINELSLFNQTNINFTNRFESQIGFRVPYHSIYSAPLIPSLHLKYNLTKNIHLRSSYARGFRAPSYKELYMNFFDTNHNIIGNSELLAESTHAFQSSLTFIPIQELNKHLSINLEGFFNHLKDKINIANIENSDSFTYYNLSDADYYGFTSTLSTKINQSNNSSYDISIMWNIYNINNDLYTKASPKHNFSLNYTYEYGHCNCGLNLHWKLKSKYEYQVINSSNEVNSYIQNGYTLLNFNLFKNFHEIGANFYIGVKNLLDIRSTQSLIEEGIGQAHTSSVNMISWGRTFFIQLNWQPFNNF